MPTGVYKRKTKSVLERFEGKVIKSRELDECWKWTGCKNEFGYGKISYQGRNISAHRLSYQLFIAPIQQNLFVLHSCDNPECANPRHLRLGTNKDNMVDCVKRGRH